MQTQMDLNLSYLTGQQFFILAYFKHTDNPFPGSVHPVIDYISISQR